MRLVAHAVAALIAALAPPAAAQDIPTIRIAPGEAVTVRFDDGGRVGSPERGRAEWSRFDIHAARQLAGTTPPDAPTPDTVPIEPPDGVRREPIPAEEVRLRFFSVADRHALLVIENGAGRALRYRAAMTVDGRTTATDVCVVLPQLSNYEHWPHAVQGLELSHFEFIPWPPGRDPTCE